MKPVAEVEYDVYEAFDPYGFSDGGGVLRWEAVNEVYCLLRSFAPIQGGACTGTRRRREEHCGN